MSAAPGLTAPRLQRQIWLTTMVDLLALLVSFFVMTLASSQIQLDSWRALAAGLQGRFADAAAPIPVPPEAAAPRRLKPRAVDLDYLHRLLLDKAAGHPALRDATIRRLDDRVVLALPGDLLFAPDSAELSERARLAAAELATALRFLANQVVVAGHTDPTPPASTGPYASNWELSLARAQAFADALREAGYPLRLEVLGHADARREPAGDMAAARRVELAIREAKGGPLAR